MGSWKRATSKRCPESRHPNNASAIERGAKPVGRQIGNNFMTRIRREWLFIAARQFQVAAIDPRLETEKVDAVMAEVLAVVPNPITRLEQLILEGFSAQLRRSGTRFAAQSRSGLVSSAAARKIKEFLDINYQSHITYADLSRHFSRNSHHLEKQFKASFHMSIRTYLTIVRVGEVSRQIRNGDKVEAAALSVGWTKSTFYRARRKCGAD
jgi:AraC-like DNA-binding protein